MSHLRPPERVVQLCSIHHLSHFRTRFNVLLPPKPAAELLECRGCLLRAACQLSFYATSTAAELAAELAAQVFELPYPLQLLAPNQDSDGADVLAAAACFCSFRAIRA